MIKSSSDFAKTALGFSPRPETNLETASLQHKRPNNLLLEPVNSKISSQHSKPSFLTSPRTPSQHLRVTQSPMFSSTSNFPRVLVSPKNFSVTKKEVEDMLYETKSANLSGKDTMKKYNDTAKLEALLQHEYGNNKKQKKEDDESEAVRRLDEWQSVLARNQGTTGFIKPNEIVEQYKSRSGEVKEKHDFPVVRQDLYDRIAADSDDENDGKRYTGKEKAPSLMVDSGPMFRFDNHEIEQGPLANAQSLEVMQRDNNKEILNDLINRKIREYVQTVNVSAMTEEQLRVHVRKVAEEVVGQFKTLKSPNGTFMIHKSVEAIVKILKANQQELNKTLLILGPVKEANVSDNSGPVDYDMMETALMEKFERGSKDAEDLSAKIKELTLDSFNLKRDYIRLQGQIEEYKKRNASALGTAVTEVDRFIKTNQPRKRKSQHLDPEYMKLQLIRVEKHTELSDLAKKSSDTQERLTFKAREIRLLEDELETMHNHTQYYKTQLRSLYFKCLKDDQSLLQDGRNQMSYAWVVRALWKLHEEVKDGAFPSYLDTSSVKFMLDYAKSQNELEDFCRTNNMMNLASSAEDFKVLNRTIEDSEKGVTGTHGQNQHPQQIHPHQLSLNYVEGTPTTMKHKERDLESLLGEVRGQMAALKRVNLKARRQVPVGRYAFKAKGIVYKWEEVDPSQIEKIFYFHDQVTPTSNHTEEPKTKILKMDDRSKASWEQGQEKIKNLALMRRKEIDRIFKQSMHKDLDERLKATLQKTFRFLFGKLGIETFIRFLKEKSAYDQNAQGKAKKANLLLATALTPLGQPVMLTSTQGGSKTPNKTPIHGLTGDSFYKDGAMNPILRQSMFGTFSSQSDPRYASGLASRLSKNDGESQRNLMFETKTSWPSMGRGGNQDPQSSKKVNFVV